MQISSGHYQHKMWKSCFIATKRNWWIFRKPIHQWKIPGSHFPFRKRSQQKVVSTRKICFKNKRILFYKQQQSSFTLLWKLRQQKKITHIFLSTYKLPDDSISGCVKLNICASGEDPAINLRTLFDMSWFKLFVRILYIQFKRHLFPSRLALFIST